MSFCSVLLALAIDFMLILKEEFYMNNNFKRLYSVLAVGFFAVAGLCVRPSVASAFNMPSFSLFARGTHVHAGRGLSRSTRSVRRNARLGLRGRGASLKPKEIARLAELSSRSVKEAGKEIGRMRLSKRQLEDTYLRILVRQKKLSRYMASRLREDLSGIKGFVTTLRKMTSGNPAQYAGHGYELQLARKGLKRGIRIAGIGRKFSDGIKHNLTDLDVWMKYKRKNVFIECKNYAQTLWQHLPHFRADMDSLTRLGKGLKVFALRNRPKHPGIRKLLEAAGRQRDVHVLYGSPSEVARKIARMMGH